MSKQPRSPEGLKVHQIRVYYDPSSGNVVHVHQLVTPPGESLNEQRIAEEMNIFEKTLRQRHDIGLEYLVIDESELQRASGPEGNLRVDVPAKRLIPAE